MNVSSFQLDQPSTLFFCSFSVLFFVVLVVIVIGIITPKAASFLDASERAGLNIIVAGGTQAGRKQVLCT